jgi:hypothetical protein
MTIDVFLCHNSQDKPLVIKIAKALEQRGLNPWIDKNNIDPGAEFQRAIAEAIPETKSAAIFFGLNGVGNWQKEEIHALERERVNRQIPLIPILLPGVSAIPPQFVFMQGYNWLQLNSEKIDKQFLDNLIRGIKQFSAYARTPPDDLSSCRGINYTRLRNLLAAEDWKRADEETVNVMDKVIGKKQKFGQWSVESMKNFPCTDLGTINQLWVKYSNENFGFSVQKGIWESVDHNYKKFGACVGWKVGWTWTLYESVTFDISAPKGHLPSKWASGTFPITSPWFWWMAENAPSNPACGQKRRLFSSLASRLVNCNL